MERVRGTILPIVFFDHLMATTQRTRPGGDSSKQQSDQKFRQIGLGLVPS